MEPEPPQNITPPTRGRSDKVFHQSGFLAAYAKCGNVTQSAAAAEVSRRQHYEWLEDPEYRRAFREAHVAGIQHMVDVGHRRACETSDRLMIKFLESIPADMMPFGWDFNAAQKHEVSGQGGGPIETNVNARDALASRIASLTPATDTPSGS